MAEYAPIHPERPLRRAVVAVAISLGVHALALTLLVAWAIAVIAAARRAEAERPKEVALADLDAARWEANRQVGERPVPSVPRPLQARAKAPEHSAVAMLAPDKIGGWEAAARRTAAPSRGEASPPAPTPGGAASAGDAPREPSGGTLDLVPRPQPVRPLAMRFDPVGPGQQPVEEGTAFGGLTVQAPEAWRFTNFFGRAVQAMNSVYRYELGAPVPIELQKLIVSRQATERCSFTNVHIDRSGQLLDASVRRSSGIAELDQIIIEVIRRTAPFVNVPEGLAGGDGTYADTWGLCLGLRP